MSKEYKILVNQVRCLICGNAPYSAHVHDYKRCDCNAIAVDGGMNYLKRSGDHNLMVDISIAIDTTYFKKLEEVLEQYDNQELTKLGVICHMARHLRDSGCLDGVAGE